MPGFDASCSSLGRRRRNPWIDLSVAGGRFPSLRGVGDADGRCNRCRLPCPLGGHGLDRSALGDRRAILLGAARMVQGSAAGRRGRPALKCYARKAKRSSRVPATLRRASKRWTSSSRSAQVARARGASVPSRPRVRSATCRASTQVAAHSGDADETLGSICRWPAGGSLPFTGSGTPTVAVIDAGSRARWRGSG